ncbi:uncharacterized protein (DUF2126 family)/transglutaminase-like putative cysteine protease [Natronocella acetinitrilica]|uniref:Uncharacterized protein (DUF2126 family)/transglutaminase-like putative cysteine protease n=1 Tax=Natronocella acetinitrilica TaxID=414046 RepID=A0AAE3G0J3_9GAMM|nr:transglutaminase family protein [Natronocella acetinitrilica]MCP1673480.1 uncharacterized protein (DUF2126 family)/transglutaminase-like putative cysteine protease [Natronocella acetinitrilica]
MAIHVGIEHYTAYQFDRPVRLSPHLVRLRPAPHARTPLHHYKLHIEPADHRIYWQQDPFGNFLARVVFPEPVERLVIDVRLTAELTVINPFDFFVEQYAEHYPFRYDALLNHALEPYFEVGESGPLLQEWLRKVDRRRRPIVHFLVELNQMLQQDIGYTVRMEPGVQTCEQTLGRAIGSCRDSGWLLVQILRHLGFAARFVSGYLVQLRSDEKSLDGPSGPEADFTDLHAWAEVYIPGAGWVGLDPTSGLFAGEGHIPLACTPDPVSAAPVTGFSDPCQVSFDFHNKVTRVHEDPRVTYPYDDDQWQAVQALGRRVDAELDALDVRLTMGGEPTFVSIDDMEGAEWNTEALGKDKRHRAGILLRRLQQRLAPGALLHFGQGKWYPGEPLPRWALGCFWLDGEPLWSDERLIADEQAQAMRGVEDAAAFAQALADSLGIRQDWVAPGYEDWLHYLWKEASSPVDANDIVLPWARQFRDDLSLALARGLDAPIGYAVPLRWDTGTKRWAGGPWRFGRDAMYLLPGGAPMGFRLPVHDLPDEDLDHAPGGPPSSADAPTVIKVPRTALCVEARDGQLRVFMPPLESLDHYRDLLASIEQTAAKLGLPVLIEGAEPPSDPRLQVFKVTPDPGVIEVNIHPAANWDQLEDTTVTLYEEARQARLGTEKFMLDGRHTGTGGGNHVTLGGATPEHSPLLRRPDLLRSLVTYWQRHPSLSYLFSGLFIGPTSQAPRVDERGDQAVLMLERALASITAETNPSTVDRALRNCLADLVGNTHRSEFSIDKLYSPDSPTGRLGLLEFRGFEMPPHPRMSLAQMLLLRVMVLHFWKQPCHGPLVRWGMLLHDRYLLPHYVWEDFSEVIGELNAAGYPVRLEWFEAFQEFRFPVYGRVRYQGVELELRMALEPWPVIEDRSSVQSTSRSVDSSAERLQLRCSGFDAERFRVTCNGRPLPLQATTTPGVFVAGVRYKAWAAHHGFHPTAETDAPLVFDLVDMKLGRSVGGCVYHVAHPGGRSYETFPVNAFEAESRRISRFWEWGHKAGVPARPGGEQQADDLVHTLDLRREGQHD